LGKTSNPAAWDRFTISNFHAPDRAPCSSAAGGPRQELRCAARALSVQWIIAKLPMSERHVSRIGRLTALCMLVAAVVTIGLAIAGALKGARAPVPQLASHNPHAWQTHGN
jgi:hypothetical protein